MEDREVRAAVDDLMNLDVFFAGMLAKKLKDFKDREAGYPAGYGNLESWHVKLYSIIVPLELYSQKFDLNLGWNEEKALTEAAQQAIKDLADIFPCLWI